MGQTAKHPFDCDLEGFETVGYDEETHTTTVVNKQTKRERLITKSIFTNS
jgi:hypothetical protein